MQNSVTCSDVMASKEKFGCVLTPDLKNYRDLKEMNPKSKYDVTYIPVLFKHVNGKKLPFKLKFNEQMISANAKNPGADEGDVPKSLSISFKRLTRNEVEGGDYVPKQKDTPEEQEVEDKRMSDNIDRYLSNNETWIQTLDILAESYKSVCEDLIEKEKELKFTLKKDRKQNSIGITEFRQSTRYDENSKKDVELEAPIYRFKLSVCRSKDNESYNGRIGYFSKYYNKFMPTVFDARKMGPKNNFAKVAARVKLEDGTRRDLDAFNANQFITRKSLIGGTLELKSITASKSGLSLDNNFREMFVLKHKSQSSNDTFSNADIMQMRGGEEYDDDSDSEAPETKADDSDDENAHEQPKDKDAEPADSDDEQADPPEEKSEDTPEPEAEEEPQDEPEPEAPKKRGRGRAKKSG